MSTLAITRTPDHPASPNPVDLRGLTIDEVIPHVVGHTIDEVERELILHTLIHCCGSRTRSANSLGISIRCMRNKIHEYEDQGIAVRAPREPGVGRTSVSRLRSRHC
jgi:DNA-binding NtrC family response regulator